MRKKAAPFLLTIILVIFDQITKFWVIRNIPVNQIYGKYWNDFLWIVHVRNTGIAFSMGQGVPDFVRRILFIILPLVIVLLLCYTLLSKKEFFHGAQRWYVAGIMGGGFGTLIDRIFRFDLGVVDFISIKVYGLFGLERWPTFNVSDSCVIIFVLLLAISVIFEKKEGKKDE